MAIGIGEELPPNWEVAARTTEKGAVGFQVPVDYSGKWTFVIDLAADGGGVVTVDL